MSMPKAKADEPRATKKAETCVYRVWDNEQPVGLKWRACGKKKKGSVHGKVYCAEHMLIFERDEEASARRVAALASKREAEAYIAAHNIEADVVTPRGPKSTERNIRMTMSELRRLVEAAEGRRQ